MKKTTLLIALILSFFLMATDLLAQESERRRRPGDTVQETPPEPEEEQVQVIDETIDQEKVAPQVQSQPAPTEPSQPANTSRRRTTAPPPRSTDTDPSRNRQPNPVSVVPRPRIEDYPEQIPMPDRWRIVDVLYDEHWWDPYNRNYLKGDKPLYDDWFFSFTGVSDTVYETRSVPTPVGSSSTGAPGQLNVIGSGEQSAVNQNLLLEFVYYKGNTTFKPPDLEFRFIPVLNYNYTELDEVLGVNARPQEGLTRDDNHVGIQGAFVDFHLRNVSENYDFDSIRFGIQPFTNDFRGFLFIDSPVGIRLFGNRANNVFQYNLAWFRRMEKDTNSGLNDASQDLREDDIFVFNLYWQDTFVKGLFSQFSILHNRNDEQEFFFDNNDFIVRPASLGLERNRDYNVTYLGYALDGHIGRLNVSSQYYYAIGDQSNSVFRDDETDISAHFFALEPSVDFDWLRLRASFIYASGDDDPFDDVDTGFDAILENPQIAGADTSYWIRQAVPLIGGGRVALSGRNGVLNSLRSSKDQGQSNFSNPGLQLAGLGFDADLTPTLRLSGSWNVLAFDDTAIVEIARNQADIEREIGQDVSLSFTYRPLNNQNIVFRASYARLIADDGFKDLFLDESPDYFLFNAVLTY
jgi:hypothetical protein